jgi:LacI family transcriptional regulator
MESEMMSLSRRLLHESMNSKKQKTRAATLIDVARIAQVSVSTAARVLRNADYPVTADLRDRVREAAKRLGYVPNQLARSLRGSETTYIGLIVGNMQDPFFGGIAEAVTDEARRLPGMAIVSNMQRNPRLEIELCRQLWEHRVKGLILAGGSFDQRTHEAELRSLLASMKQSGVVVVSLAQRDLDIEIFAEDNRHVGVCLARSVLDAGHREIGAIFGVRNRTGTERLKGIQQEARKRGATVHAANGEYSIGTAGAGVEELLRAHSSITAILCGADSLAVGARQRLQKLGVRVPEDISLVGLGDTDYAHLMTPRLSSVNTNPTAWARAAVQFIGRKLVGDPDAARAERRDSMPAVAVIGDTISAPRGVV